jgi:hypothetical protein
MKFGIQSVEHFFARFAKEAVIVSKSAGSVLAKVDATAEANKPLIEGLTAAIDPNAVALEDAAYALLGMAAKAASELSGAADAKGLNLALDQQTVTDIKALVPAIQKYAASKGATKPTS